MFAHVVNHAMFFITSPSQPSEKKHTIFCAHNLVLGVWDLNKWCLWCFFCLIHSVCSLCVNWMSFICCVRSDWRLWANCQRRPKGPSWSCTTAWMAKYVSCQLCHELVALVQSVKCKRSICFVLFQTIEDFLTNLETCAEVCGFMLKKGDKKKERYQKCRFLVVVFDF